jgi:hypothetical protein
VALNGSTAHGSLQAGRLLSYAGAGAVLAGLEHLGVPAVSSKFNLKEFFSKPDWISGLVTADRETGERVPNYDWHSWCATTHLEPRGLRLSVPCL